MVKFSNAQELARRIDYTLIAADATRQDVEKLCAEARQHSFFSVCVNGSRVELARALLEESGVQVTALVGFPLGAGDTDAKRYETEIAIDLGAHEIDFVINLGWLKDGDHKAVLRELRDIVEAADERPVKVVLESHLLKPEEKVLACRLAAEAGAQFVVTSTGFHVPEVTAEEIKFLKGTAGEELGVKAVGGIRNGEMALRMLESGAGRIGALSGNFEL